MEIHSSASYGSHGKIAYMMSRFPHLPETFILREMVELERQGWQVALYPLIRQKQAVVHEEARPWMERANALPFLSGRIAVENARQLVIRPLNYAALVGRILKENAANPGFLARSLALLPKAVYMARKMQAEGVQHIHAHYATHPALAAWIIHRLTGIPYSITAHAHDIFVSQTMLGPKVRDAAFVVAISEYNRSFIARHVGEWAREKTHVIHCGIDPACYTPRQAVRAKDAPLEILSIGSLQPYKGQQHLVDACAVLRGAGVPFHCRIIGGGEERVNLERQIAKLGLANCVELMGPRPQEEVARLLPTASCYVQPSVIQCSGKMEGIPVALMEALACQVPAVATAISGIPELIRPGETGYLVSPANPRAIANTLVRIVEQPEEAAALAAGGRALVLRAFNLCANVARLSDLFSEGQKTAL